MSYIEREAVLKIIADNCPHDKCGYNTEEEMGAGAACYYIRKDVDNLPTADVVEVRHGKWLHENNPNTDIYEHRPLSICSECGHTRIGDKPYCAECGAKMDGEARNQLLEEIKGCRYTVVEPDADVVEVVRCRECRHNEDNGGDCNRTITHISRNYVCEVNEYKYIGLEYCSYGERREE